MYKRSRSTQVLSLVTLIFQFCYCNFVTDYLGNLSDDEYNNRNFCWTKVCMQDSGRMIYAARHDSIPTDPCDDFRKFAMGEFLEHRVPNERYAKVGFKSDIDAQFFEKQKRILNEPVKPGAPKIFTIVKSFFKKCINSANIIADGPADMLSYMRRLNLPIANGGDWNENDFDVHALFKYDQKLAFDLFLDMEFTILSSDTVRLRKRNSWKFHQHLVVDMLNLMEPMNVEKQMIKAAVEDFTNFLEAKLPFETADLNIHGSPHSYRHKMEEYLDSKQWNSWKIVLKNYLLFLGFDPSEEISVVLYQPLFLQNISDVFEKLSKRQIANIFTVALVHYYREGFIVYPFSKEKESFEGTKRSYQRFEQCLQFLETKVPLAFNVLIAEKLLDKSAASALIEIANKIVDEIANEVIKHFNINLKELRTYVMYSDDAANLTKVDEAYKNLQLLGSESFVEMYIEIEKHNRYEPYGRSVEREIIEIPIKWMLYPAFHVNRPRFFTVVVLQSYLFRLIRQVHGTFMKLKEVELAYRYYSEWLDKGHEDLHLPAFKMTSRQMFWVTYVHVMTEKYQFFVSKNFEIAGQLTNHYINVLLKNITAFREDFQCKEMAPKEKHLLQEFEKKKQQIMTASKKDCLRDQVYCFEKDMARFKDPELFNFIKSVLADPKHADDLKNAAHLLNNGTNYNPFLLKILSFICPSEEDCHFSF